MSDLKETSGAKYAELAIVISNFLQSHDLHAMQGQWTWSQWKTGSMASEAPDRPWTLCRSSVMGHLPLPAARRACRGGNRAPGKEPAVCPCCSAGAVHQGSPPSGLLKSGVMDKMYNPSRSLVPELLSPSLIPLMWLQLRGFYIYLTRAALHAG